MFLSIPKSLVGILNSGTECRLCGLISWCVENSEVACSSSKIELCDFVENYKQKQWRMKSIPVLLIAPHRSLRRTLPGIVKLC